MIHKTLRGEMVRSKSELTIADRLFSHQIDYVYEQALTFQGQTRYPDFTIEDASSGERCYWEHLGLLNDPIYRSRWERKLRWYKDNGILPADEGGGANGKLIMTHDDAQGGISSQAIENLILEFFS